MKREDFISLAESFLDVAVHLQDKRDTSDTQTAEILNLSLRAQIMRDISVAFRNAAQKS